MGATIDYAIIVTNHYREERRVKPKDIAIYDAMSASFPAIITSGTIMVIAPLFVGIFISDPLVSSIGYCLSRGSFISILSVLTVLPQLLYTFEKAFMKTTFRYGKKDKKLTFAPDYAIVDNSVDTTPQKLFKETPSDSSNENNADDTSSSDALEDSETIGVENANGDVDRTDDTEAVKEEDTSKE